MRVVVLTDTGLKKELLAQGVQEPIDIKWITGTEELKESMNEDAYIDLLFKPEPKRIELLETLLPRPVLINSVVTQSKALPEGFARFNGWPTFLKRKIIEAAFNKDSTKKRTEEIFSAFNKKVEWVADEPGFISARVVAMIINEAYFALEEGVSSITEIDIAMKLGTNYPYGPFQWAENIGIKRIADLLNKLCSKNKRFNPSELILKETRK